MAIESTPEGYTYPTTDAEAGTAAISRANAFNSDAKLKYFKSLTGEAQADAATALGTLGAVRDLAKQANQSAALSALSSSSSAAASNAAADTVERFGDDVELLKQMGQITPGSVTDAQTAILIQDQQSETHARLNAQIGYVPGVVANDATDNTAAIQAAADEGGRWMLPASTGIYRMAGEVTLTVPGTELHFGNVKIRNAPGKTAFRAVAPDCLISANGVGVDGRPNFTGMNTTWEGSIIASRWCMINIYSTAHRLRIPYIRGEGMSSAVRSGRWDAITDTATTDYVEDVEIGTIQCARVEFAHAFKGTKRMKINRVVGSYGDTATMPRPPHLVYFADDVNGDSHVDPWVGEAIAYNGEQGHAFQFKGISGGKAGKLLARNCAGSLNIMATKSMDIEELTSFGDTFNVASGGSVSVDNEATPSVVTIGKTHIEMAVDGRPFHVINNNGGDFGEVDIYVNHQRAPGSSDYDLIMAGSNNKAHVSIHNAPTATHGWRGATVWGTGTGNQLTAGTIEGVMYGVDARTSPDAVIRYNLDQITLHPVNGVNKLATVGTAGQRFISDEGQLFGMGYRVADLFDVGTGSNSYLALASTGQPWTMHSGFWPITNHEVTLLAPISGATATLDAGLSNVRIESEVKFSHSEGIVFRFIDTANWLAARIRSTAVEIENAGSTIATTPFTAQTGRWYALAVNVYGNVVDVYVDGAKVLTHTLEAALAAEHATATRHGYRLNVTDGKFRRFRIKGI